MSHLEETVLRTESGINLNKKGEKKYTFNPPGGTLILTDQRLIFAQSGGEFAKRLVVGGLLGGIVGSEAMRLATKVKKEQLDEALQRPDSAEIHLQDLTDAKEKTEWGAHLLIIESQAPNLREVQLFRQGGISGMKNFNDWITDIKAAKQRAPAFQQPAAAPQYYAPPSAAAAQPQSGRFCPSCGAPVPAQNRFCGSCGASIQPQQAACAQCGATLSPGQRFCGSCGAQAR